MTLSLMLAKTISSSAMPRPSLIRCFQAALMMAMSSAAFGATVVEKLLDGRGRAGVLFATMKARSGTA